MIALKSINILHCKISKLQLKNTKSSENEQKRKNKMDHFKQLSKRKKGFILMILLILINYIHISIRSE